MGARAVTTPHHLKVKRDTMYWLVFDYFGRVPCFVCGKHVEEEEKSIEHKIAKSEGGGSKEWGNLAISHIRCNSERGSKHVDGDPFWRNRRELDRVLRPHLGPRNKNGRQERLRAQQEEADRAAEMAARQRKHFEVYAAAEVRRIVNRWFIGDGPVLVGKVARQVLRALENGGYINASHRGCSFRDPQKSGLDIQVIADPEKVVRAFDLEHFANEIEWPHGSLYRLRSRDGNEQGEKE